MTKKSTIVKFSDLKPYLGEYSLNEACEIILKEKNQNSKILSWEKNKKYIAKEMTLLPLPILAPKLINEIINNMDNMKLINPNLLIYSPEIKGINNIIPLSSDLINLPVILEYINKGCVFIVGVLFFYQISKIITEILEKKISIEDGIKSLISTFVIYSAAMVVMLFFKKPFTPNC